MKLFNAIAAAAVIGTSLITANPVEAGVKVNLTKNTISYINDGSDRLSVCRGYVCWEVQRSESNRYPLGDSSAINASKESGMTREQHQYYSTLCSSC